MTNTAAATAVMTRAIVAVFMGSQTEARGRAEAIKEGRPPAPGRMTRSRGPRPAAAPGCPLDCGQSRKVTRGDRRKGGAFRSRAHPALRVWPPPT